MHGRVRSLVVVLGVMASPVVGDAAGAIGKDCRLNGKTLQGKVRIVEHFADFKVKRVTSFPDLKVQVVENFPDSCGKWKFVKHFPDFTVQFVDHFPNFTVKYVDHFPGVP